MRDLIPDENEVLLPLILRELYGQGVDYGGLAHPV